MGHVSCHMPAIPEVANRDKNSCVAVLLRLLYYLDVPQSYRWLSVRMDSLRNVPLQGGGAICGQGIDESQRIDNARDRK